MLRLTDPGLFFAGIALALLSAASFGVAWKRQQPLLYLSVLGFLVAATPKLIVGGLDLLIWFDLADHNSFVPRFVLQMATLQGYALLLAAAPVALCTYHLRRKVENAP